ncbi:Pentatricopeptide repeat-containing protein [Forsythia ovata]|uniref:Pentatricopeptide repeat-containing protein n=1 Tax=Forsythia ovata TaxID=205694 RepID=A0ABD1X0P4_9LAMI
MILGCGINGRANDAIKLFEEMMEAEINPNLYGLVPSVDHYAIVVDLLGRAGRLEEAHELIKSMPMQPHAGVWGALLLACSLHNNVELAEIAAKHCFELEPDSSGYCSLLANIYASVGKWADANRLRKAIEERGLIKVPGSSWMESAKT